MNPKVHWRDLLIGAAGIWLIASPTVLGYNLVEKAASNAVGVGWCLVIFCVISAWRLADLGNEILNIVMGCWLVLSPFSLGFSEQRTAELNAIAVGLLVAGLAIWDLSSVPRAK
ncbi:MAG TPA: SPW repeat protein [Burkholderiales bacterium]|nr:SPW repeat protein [Burkholderiales bacterium]